MAKGKYIPHILFLVIMTIYFITRVVRVTSDVLFIKYYLTDLLFVPAMCLFALIFTRLIRRDSTLLIPSLYVFIQVILVSLFFEWYLPKHGMYGNTYTADPYDAVMYFVGGIIFIVLQRTILKKENAPLS
jgi:hypothetical protein